MPEEVELNTLFIKLNVGLNKKEKGKESTRGIRETKLKEMRGTKMKGVKGMNGGKKNTNHMPLVSENLSDKDEEVNGNEENKGGKLRRKK